MNWLYIASLLSATTALLHIFGGGKSTAQPLLASDLGDEAKYTNYYCWHMVTITIITMAICFFLAARSPENLNLAILASILALAFTLWSLLLIIIKRQNLFTLPQWILFLPIAIAGFVGSF